MKKFLFYMLAAIAPTSAMAQAIDTAPEGYTLVWQDEFNGTALDEKVWNIEVNGDGGGNQELQFYRRENVSVKDGNLVLTARRENYSNRSFTSGRINSRNKVAFKHGFLQARIKMPKTANGLWPAYWMMGNDFSQVGWPRCGEMDIVEMGHFNGINNGTQDRYFAGTLHYGPSASNTDHQQMSQDFTADESNPVCNGEYHIFTVEWDDNYVYMYYDLDGFTAAKKRKARYFTGEITASNDVYSPGKYFQKEFFFIFNLAVGGSFTNIYNANNITALKNQGDEAQMLVDWVRVYQKEDDENRIYITPDGSNVTPGGGTGGSDLDEDFDTEIGRYGSKALDENGKSTFDFDKASDAVLIGTSYGVSQAFYEKTAADYSVDDVKNFLWVWSDTYSAMPSDGVNSFGWEEPYNHYQVNSVGWSGLGYASNAGAGKDLTMLDDDYILHFAMRGVDPDRHASHEITVGDAKFTLGNYAMDGTAILGDFRRDGSWTAFDIPMKVLETLCGGDNPFGSTVANYSGNVFAILSGGSAGTDLQFDNIFFYKSSDGAGDVPTTDTTTDIGQYGSKSVVNGMPTFDFDNVADAVLIGTSGGVTGALTDMTLADYNVDNQTHFLYIWDGGDYVSMPSDGPNSFGWEEDHLRLQVGAGTWNGAGYAGVAPGKDLTMIDDSYYLHFALKGNDVLTHASQTIMVGNAKFIIGSTTDGNVILGDYKRDGEWYSFDIPVAVIAKLAGKELFTNAKNYTDNVFAFSTTNAKGNEINIDNVFFYKKKDGTVVELPEMVSKALDAEGKSTFDLDDVRNAVLIGTSFGVTQALSENTAADYNVDDVNNFFYNWENTYVSETSTGVNSFGWEESYVSMTVGNVGWSGAGYASQNKGKDLSMIKEGYYLHFAMKGTDNATHRISIGKAMFSVGSEAFNDNGIVTAPIADYPRDGEWYNFDIPYNEIAARASIVFPGATNFTDNVFSILSGGVAGTRLQLDNIFFYQKASEGAESNIESVKADVTTPAIYNIAGQRVDAGYRGIVICNGKKYFVK